MSRGSGTESTECLDGRVPASDAILCCGMGNDCGESEICCAAMAGATLTNKGNSTYSSVSGNAGAASGGVWNDRDASDDKVEGDKRSCGTNSRSAQDWNQRVYKTAQLLS